MSDENRIAEILGEWRERRDGGGAADPEEVCRAHPALAGELRARFAAMELVDRAFAPVRDPGAPPPETLGEFRIVREIGRGGMGVVYEAVQETLGRRVALKVLSPAVTGSTRAVGRFLREARAAGRLNHTSIVSVHAMGEVDGLFYYAMEFVDGRPLSAVIEDARREGSELFGGAPGTPDRYRRVAERVAGVAEALEAAHREGVIHRDVKPGNLLCAGGALKLADFGLARVDDGGLAMTISGDFVGTPMYMSPEQARARNEVDHRTDVYSLGATLYELFTLRPPVTAKSFPDAYLQVVEGTPARPRSIDPRIPKDLETVVLKAMQKRKADRYATAGELARDLRRYVEGVPVLARRPSPLLRLWRAAARHKAVAGLAAAIVLLAVAVAWLGVMWADEAALREQAESGREEAESRYRRLEELVPIGIPERPVPPRGSAE